MVDASNFKDVHGILAILAEDPNWPNPANIYLVPDANGFSLIDVGCGGDASIRRLMDGLRYWSLEIQQLHTVVLSHAHPDHMGAMWWILEEVNPRVIVHHQDAFSALDPIQLEQSFDIPLAKHCWAAATGDDALQNFALLKFFEDSGCPMSAVGKVEEIHDGDRLQLGNFVFEAVHTPGHSPGHISLYESKKRLLLPGDLVGKAPAWYVPASGGVSGYLESLAKLEALDADILLPGHGPVIEDAAQAIRRIRKKLLKRHSILYAALQKGEKSFMEMIRLLIDNPLIHFFPGCGIIESHLKTLEREGVIQRKGQNIIAIT